MATESNLDPRVGLKLLGLEQPQSDLQSNQETKIEDKTHDEKMPFSKHIHQSSDVFLVLCLLLCVCWFCLFTSFDSAPFVAHNCLYSQISCLSLLGARVPGTYYDDHRITFILKEHEEGWKVFGGHLQSSGFHCAWKVGLTFASFVQPTYLWLSFGIVQMSSKSKWRWVSLEHFQ